MILKRSKATANPIDCTESVLYLVLLSYIVGSPNIRRSLGFYLKIPKATFLIRHMAHLQDHALSWVTGIWTDMGLTFLTHRILELFKAALTGTLLLICLS